MHRPRYELFERAGDPGSATVVSYLLTRGVDARANTITERDHPVWVTELPSIRDIDTLF